MTFEWKDFHVFWDLNWKAALYYLNKSHSSNQNEIDATKNKLKQYATNIDITSIKQVNVLKV